MGVPEFELDDELEVKIPLRKEVREKLRNLRNPNELKSSVSIAIDWLFICLGYLLILKSYLWVPIGILIIGSRQRALSNLSHDSAHFNLFRKKSVNDSISNIFCSLPMFETVGAYRKNHNQHHKHLGDLDKDPDSSAHLKYGYNDSLPWRGNPALNYSRLIFNRVTIVSSLFGSLFSLTKKDKIALALWWTFAVCFLVTLTTFKMTAILVGCWFLAKLTSYHFVRIFAEFLDHSGLDNKDVISFTRNLPHKGLLRFIFHPNCDTYHIVHHLYPSIPHYNMSEADKVLEERVDYKYAHHCDSYFFGAHSAVKCWVGNCGRSHK
jgi:fatty acid desaturase